MRHTPYAFATLSSAACRLYDQKHFLILRRVESALQLCEIVIVKKFMCVWCWSFVVSFKQCQAIPATLAPAGGCSALQKAQENELEPECIKISLASNEKGYGIILAGQMDFLLIAH